MPAFHVSVNFDLQGPYFVTYPGPGQFYIALDEALTALDEGNIDVALVGGVAHQRNFLVESHFRRVEPPVPPERLVDAAGFLVLERASRAGSRGARPRARLVRRSLQYHRDNPFKEAHPPREHLSAALGMEPDAGGGGEAGPASLPLALSRNSEDACGRVTHLLWSRDGVRVLGFWEYLWDTASQ
jgi:hypothetical protein